MFDKVFMEYNHGLTLALSYVGHSPSSSVFGAKFFCYTAFWHKSFWNLSSDFVLVLDRFNSFNREKSIQPKHGLGCNFSGRKALPSFPPLGFRGNEINDHASLAGRVCSGTTGIGSWRCSSPTWSGWWRTRATTSMTAVSAAPWRSCPAWYEGPNTGPLKRYCNWVLFS